MRNQTRKQKIVALKDDVQRVSKMNVRLYLACASLFALTLPAMAAPDLNPSAAAPGAHQKSDAGILLAQGQGGGGGGPPPHAGRGKGGGGDGGGPGQHRGRGGG